MDDIRTSFPSCFYTGRLDGLKDNEVCAYGLCAWAICHGGLVDEDGIPPLFGEVMIAIGTRLGCTASPEGLLLWAKEHG